MNVMPLTVAIAAGGTAGHINPALALAEELRDRGHHVYFFGQERRLEKTLVPEAGFDLLSIDVSGFDREKPWTLLSSGIKTLLATSDIKAYFVKHGLPDVAVGFGAYVEVPLLRACKTLRVPYLIHEQNSIPGLANKMVSKHCALLCLAIPQARSAFSKVDDKRICVTGNPVRKSVITASRKEGRALFDIPDDATMLLVFGGSLGARHINETMCALKDELLQRKQVCVVHSSGKEAYEQVLSALDLTQSQAQRYILKPYISQMGEALAASDLVLSRAGASSVAEIAALGLPSILVPYPFATADHQRINARFLEDAGAALVIDDADLDKDVFSTALFDLLDNENKRNNMKQKASELAMDSSAQKLADCVERIGIC